MPTVFGSMVVVRRVLLHERIHIVHGHSSFSALAHETLFHAINLGLKVRENGFEAGVGERVSVRKCVGVWVCVKESRMKSR